MKVSFLEFFDGNGTDVSLAAVYSLSRFVRLLAQLTVAAAGGGGGGGRGGEGRQGVQR
eukprot:COSAG06_NODE_13955_length_1202_cov_1.311877_1_plen_58_part_00